MQRCPPVQITKFQERSVRGGRVSWGSPQSWGSGEQERDAKVLAHRCFPGCLPSRPLSMCKGEARAGMRKLVSTCPHLQALRGSRFCCYALGSMLPSC